MSTCLAAAVGAIAILIVVYGSSDSDHLNDGLLPTLKSIGEGALVPQVALTPKNADGLKWVMPKSDRLQLTTGALSTRYIIHESSKSRRDSREYVRQKPYARIVARLAPVPADQRDNVPAFNPFKLYGSQPSELDTDENAGSGLSKSDVSTKVVELLGGILPQEDGQELDTQEVQDIVERSAANSDGPGYTGDGSGAPLDGVAGSGPPVSGQDSDSTWQPRASTTDNLNTTDIYKTAEAPEEPTDDFEGGKVIVVTVGPKDTLAKILAKAGAPEWDVHSMIEAGHSIFPENALVPGQEVRITLVPSLTDPNKMEPARYSVFSDGHDHLVTVSRSAAGEFVGSSTPPFDEELQHAANGDDDPQSATLYAAIYNAAHTQSVPAETIQKILSVNAYDTDFRRRVRPGDTLEMFFDMKDDQSPDGPPGELLYTALSSGGTVYKFYRFRSDDGIVDYYDDTGNDSKKFLIRKPVRGDDVRLTSGFGIRFHPLLNTRRMHTGVDWACAIGTPIIAAGNGTIEEEGRKGYYGNYIRIRHANGYQTAYAHMNRFGKFRVGDKVRQGQIIGYVGSTGLSTGSHVHFEVLVNNRFVDPMSIQVPRERKLEGKDLAEFQKERGRIEELMRRAPVMTANK
ncbi:MAG TPA: peptidoglycan DD-metalloendopeptidase family protein [Hyphomicrobium sp.]|nr:peptidoglycan DD-metalloendopeptidase family protein [Hyphomicrobium sp.]